MKYRSEISAGIATLLAGAWLAVGCCTGTPPAPPQQVELRQITNGITITFSAVPDDALIRKLFDAGALTPQTSMPTVFIFTTIDTDAKRDAVNAAMLAGGRMKL